MRVLITGVTGQDGSYLAEHLAAEGCEIYGMVRSWQHPRCDWIEQLVPGIQLVIGDLLDPVGLTHLIARVQPDEIYNLAAVTSPGERWSTNAHPLLAEVTGLGPINLVRATHDAAPTAHLVHASSSAIYDTRRYGLYGSAKRLAHEAVVGYRECHALHVSNAVLYSHTSPRQSDRFLIRRVVRHVVDVRRGRESSFIATNLVNSRDWGWAPDYVRALPLMARSTSGHDRDIRTGITHTVGDAVRSAAAHLNVEWSRVVASWPNTRLEYDCEPEVEATPRLQEPLGWQPRVSFDEMIQRLVEVEMRRDD